MRFSIASEENRFLPSLHVFVIDQDGVTKRIITVFRFRAHNPIHSNILATISCTAREGTVHSNYNYDHNHNHIPKPAVSRQSEQDW